MTCLFEFLLDGLITVKLSVHNDSKALILIGNRLVPGRQIDNAEPCVAETNSTILSDPMTLTVRATMMQAFGCPLQRLGWYRTILGENSNYSTHLNAP